MIEYNLIMNDSVQQMCNKSSWEHLQLTDQLGKRYYSVHGFIDCHTTKYLKEKQPSTNLINSYT